MKYVHNNIQVNAGGMANRLAIIFDDSMRNCYLIMVNKLATALCILIVLLDI